MKMFFLSEKPGSCQQRIATASGIADNWQCSEKCAGLKAVWWGVPGLVNQQI